MVSYALSGVQMRPRTNSGHSLSRFSVPNPERSKIRSRVGERALGRDLMRVLLRIITAYGERRPAELLLRFGRQGPVFIPDRTLTLLIGRQ